MARRRLKIVTTVDPQGRPMKVYPGDDLPEWMDESRMPQSVFAPDEEEAGTVEQNNEEASGYWKMTVPLLLKEAKDRELEIFSTKKADVIAALEADDADDDD